MLKQSFSDNINKYDSTKDKIARHLKDINDTISEDDIHNINTNLSIENNIIFTNGIIEIPDNKNIEVLKNKHRQKKVTLNSWNIIS